MVEVIVKVAERKDGVKYVIIPKRSKINKEQYVVVSNNMDMLKEIKKGGKDGRRKEE